MPPEESAPTKSTENWPTKLPVYRCPPDCGLCCTELLVECTASDIIREPRIDDVAPLGKNLAMPILDACWLLSGEKGCPFLDSQKRCSIYATRPWTCIAFAAGGKQCTELRQRASLPPLQPTVADGSIVDRLIAEMTNDEDE